MREWEGRQYSPSLLSESSLEYSSRPSCCWHAPDTGQESPLSHWWMRWWPSSVIHVHVGIMCILSTASSTLCYWCLYTCTDICTLVHQYISTYILHSVWSGYLWSKSYILVRCHCGAASTLTNLSRLGIHYCWNTIYSMCTVLIDKVGRHQRVVLGSHDYHTEWRIQVL